MPVNRGTRWKIVAAGALAGAVGCVHTPAKPVQSGIVVARPATRPATAPGPVESSPVAGVPITRSPVTVAPVTTGPVAVAVPTETVARQAARPQDVATADLGHPYQPVPGLAKKPKPFIAFPSLISSAATPSGKPSTELLTHVSPDSPMPLSEYPSQPVHPLVDFKLTTGLTAAAVQARFGLPAALADADDPWYVYRLEDDRELWLHFTTAGDRLRSADVVRGAEDGYERTTVFPK